MESQYIDSFLFAKLIRAGANNLSAHANEVNDLNVFPIPDGDTGSNMLLTMQGAMIADPLKDEGIGSFSRRAADGMLLSARGNSGVILSQFFDGLAEELEGKIEADANDTASAFRRGVKHAYASVMDPVEGTILTVAREASEYAANRHHEGVSEYLSDFLYQANETLRETPNMLPILKKASVVDSGGAGLVYIIEGAAAALNDDVLPEYETHIAPASATGLDLDRFNEDSVLTYGYCTELLLRLQRAKTDLEQFDIDVIKDYLQSAGDSVVCFRSGSIVKIHVHTKTPYKVLEFCQRYGEYLTVKIENMSLQHNNLPSDSKALQNTERKTFAIVAVASGEGIKQTFGEMGADCIVEGGQSMNPSANDFIEAFERVHADTVFVLPNNGNVILTAKQAAKMYSGSDIRVIESRSIGDCYAVLTMLDTESGNADEIEREMTDAMKGVVTAEVSRCTRSTETDGFFLRKGQYIGFVGKEIVSADNDRMDTACMLADRLDFTDHEICIIVRGADSEESEAREIASHIRKANPGCEVFVIDGGQEIYSYILIIE
ncbi:MAG: DAK2 domain-containing protein [Clostridia bacterium]|nr:DAK2 domain-containing protein [Clostridia bacterium]